MAEVVNYIDAMNHGIERLRELPVSLRLLREIHERLLAGVRGSERYPGEFRRTQNWIGSSVDTLETASFVPPPPHAMAEALDNLEKFLHDETPMPTLVKVGLVHAQFETIHPFLDGNGRLGRLLITFLLLQKGILHRPLLYLSHHFKRYRAEYYARLQATRDRGDWEGWLKFFLTGVAVVAEEAASTARQIMRMREAHRDLVTRELRRNVGRGMVLLEDLYYRPVVSVASVTQSTGLTVANANTLVNQFHSLGLLREITGRRRGRLFAYDPYLALFEDPSS